MNTKIDVILNNYERIDPASLLVYGSQEILNGPNNEFFYKIENRYNGSPTLSAVIDSYSQYVMGNGLIAEEGISQEDLDRILDEEDLREIIFQYKLQGNAPILIDYAKSGSGKIAAIYGEPARKVAIKMPESGDITDDIDTYFYCFDFKRGIFPKKEIKAFGKGNKNEREIFLLKRKSNQDIYSLPDYFSCIQYAQIEEEVTNFKTQYIKNNFSAGKVINIYQGEIQSEEEEEVAQMAIKRKLTGSINAGEPIIAFNKDKDEKVEIDTIEIQDAYRQFEYLEESAQRKIFLANKVTSPSLFGDQANTGFSAAGEEMEQALNLLYRNQINPMRRQIIRALEEILGEGVKLKFDDFDDLKKEDEEIESEKENIDKNNEEI